MRQSDLEQIVNEVTRQVLAVLKQELEPNNPCAEGMRKVLVIGGNESRLPQNFCQDAVFYGIDDYQAYKNVRRYDQIVIVSLNMTQLSDIAHGRIGDEVSCAVLHGLLNGTETWMLDDALTFRTYAGKGSTALYHLLEQYAQTLQVFGIKPIRRERIGDKELPPPRPPKFQAPVSPVPQGSAKPNINRLITEAEALALVKDGGNITLPAGTIVTPAAMDVFAQAGVSLNRNCGARRDCHADM